MDALQRHPRTGVEAMDGLPIPPHPGFAWAVGLFEGEGCISVHWGRGGSRHLHVRYAEASLQIGMTDEEPIRGFHRVVGFGTVVYAHAPSHQRRGAKPLWCWRVRGKYARELLAWLYPFLSPRRQEQANCVMAVIARPEIGQRAAVRHVHVA